MAKKVRTLGDVQKRMESKLRESRRQDRIHGVRGGLDFREMLSAVCKYHCMGLSAGEIVIKMKKKHNVVLKREEPFQYVAFAASKGWLSFRSAPDGLLRQKIVDSCSWLDGIEVVPTAVFDDVGAEGARMLLGVCQRLAVREKRKEVHIGFAGGHAMRKTAAAFARLLRQPTQGLPETLVFHALVVGFDVNDPTTDPNAFFLFFLEDTAMQVKTRFVGLRAPAVVETKDFARTRKLPGVNESFLAAKDLDIIVTSSSCWSDKHSLLLHHMGSHPKSREILKKAGCIGDMLWRPFGPKGPIETATNVRALTLMDLSDLPKRIEKGMKVLLTLGPCGACGTPKGEALKAILKMEPPLITHLVVDTRTARAVYKTA